MRVRKFLHHSFHVPLAVRCLEDRSSDVCWFRPATTTLAFVPCPTAFRLDRQGYQPLNQSSLVRTQAADRSKPCCLSCVLYCTAAHRVKANYLAAVTAVIWPDQIILPPCPRRSIPTPHEMIRWWDEMRWARPRALPATRWQQVRRAKCSRSATSSWY